MNTTRIMFAGVAFLAALLLAATVSAQTTYNQNAAGVFAPGANAIEKSATAAPNNAAEFATAVAAAYSTNSGGVFDLPTSVTGGTTVYRATYGSGATRRLVLTTSVGMQNVTGSGSFTPVSGGNATTSSANQSSYRVRIGPVLDAATDLPVAEVVTRIGLAILSRTDATYPCDIRATVSFNDGTTSSATANVGNPKSSDDTFFGFIAPETLAITNLLLESFVSGTTTPVSTRIGWDDFGFITGPSFVPPPPTIYDIHPPAYAIHAATNGVQFQVQSAVGLDPAAISLVLNANDVSAQLLIGGEATNRLVSFAGLQDDQEYTMTLTATNVGGVTSVTRTFYTATGSFVLYDSQGFTNDALYPLGALQPVTDGRATWTPSALEPAEFVDVGDPQGKVLQRLTTGVARADVLDFPQLSSGTIIIEFDVWVSTIMGRTIDVSLQPTTGGNVMASFLSWGELAGKLCYYDNVNWLPLADWAAAGWHRCKIINYLSGPAAGRYDVLVDGSPVGLRIPWRNAAAGGALGRFRYRSESTGSLFDYGNIDNLVITAAQEDANAFLAPTILNVMPANNGIIRPSDGISFEVTSGEAISAANVALLLDGVPVSLSVTGSPTHLYASYSPTLAVGNHSVQIFATNSVDTAAASANFIATDEAWLVHPANGWAEAWQWGGGTLEYRTEGPIDGAGPYLRLTAPGGSRNFMRQFQSGTNLDISQPHFIRWKFRLADDNFAANFTVFNDRVQFFGRNTSRLTASTDSSINWSVMATGAESSAGSGISAGQTFWVFDNVDGTGNLILGNYVDTQVALIPNNIYVFNLRLDPAQHTYTVAMTNETSGAWFKSAAPHRYRNLSVPGADHTYLHLGVQCSGSDEPRPFDLDSVQLVQATLPANLFDPQRAGSAFSFSFTSQPSVTYYAEYAKELPATQWYPLETIAGDGSVKTVTDANASDGERYYRVRAQ